MTRKRDYAAEYVRRKARARAEGYKSFWAKRAAAERKSMPSYQDLTSRQKDSWHRAFRAVREMADRGIPLRQAAKRQGTTPGTVIKYGPDWLERKGRKWVPAKAFLERQGLISRPEGVNIITESGIVAVTISDAKTLSEYGRYMNYVKGALRGDPDAMAELAQFEGRTFTDAEGKQHAYVTDRRLLGRLYDDGRISMEEFYVEVAR